MTKMPPNIATPRTSKRITIKESTDTDFYKAIHQEMRRDGVSHATTMVKKLCFEALVIRQYKRRPRP